MPDMGKKLRIISIRTGRNILLGGIMALILSVLIVVASFGQTNGQGRVMGIIFAVFSLNMIGIPFSRKLLSPDYHPLIRLLDSTTEDKAVWIYPITLRSYGIFKSYQISVNTLKKQQINIMVRKRELDPVMTYLQESFPQARFGYSKELEDAYQNNPSGLLDNV